MSEELPTDIVELAEEYLESLDGGDDVEGNLEEVRGNLEYWEQQVEEFEEGTAMHEMAVGERDEFREKLEAIDARGERRERLRSELLTRASTEFAPQGGWLETVVIRALSHAFHGQQFERLFLDEFCLPDDQDGMSKRDMVTVAKTVHTLARDAYGDEDQIAEVWDALNTKARLPIAQVLARHSDPMSSGSISDELGEEGPNDPGSNIRELRGRLDIEPFYGSNRGYTLTLPGRYVLRAYGPDMAKSLDTVAIDGRAGPDEGEAEAQAEAAEDSAEEGEAGRDEVEDEPDPVQSEGASADDDNGQEESKGEVDLSSFEIRE